MPSFDIVCKVDPQELDNAVNQTLKEISQRFDFKNSKSEVTLDKETSKMVMLADDELKLRSLKQILETKLIKRGIDIRSLKYSKEEQATQNMIRVPIEMKSGIDREESKKIIQLVKDSKLKVQTEIQGEQLRVTGKKIDDLQSVIQLLKGSNLGLPLQFINMRG